MILQLYEIQTPEEAEAVVELGVDHVGSVILSASDWKNSVIRETVAAVSSMGAKSSLILLFEDVETVTRALDYYRPDIVHFCRFPWDAMDSWQSVCGGMLSLHATVKERFPGIEVMRSVPVPAGQSIEFSLVEQTAVYLSNLSDYLLLDTYVGSGTGGAGEPVEGFIGITGMRCDWDIAAKVVAKSTVPVILAGGLSPENVYEAVMRVKPAGVDSCTKTNLLDENGKPLRFKKDLEKVRLFVKEARRAEADLKLKNQK